MKQFDLFKKMLPGLVPILFFIVADEIWGTKIGLIVAVIIGIIQLAYFAFKEKRLEKFVLFDTLLIIAMGAISIALDNDIFFKLKPSIIELILIGVLLFSLLSKHNVMLNMSKRYLKEVEFNENQNKLMHKSIRNLLYVLLLHLTITLYATFWMSTEAWAFISTALMYIMVFAYFGVELALRYFRNKNIEYLPVIDMDGKLIGKASRAECHSNPQLIYPVVRLHLFNSKGEILLQKRALSSDIEPGKWDAAVAGHVHFGEEIEQALKRESKEEINFEPTDFQLINRRIFKAKTSTAMMFVFVCQTDISPKANTKEVEEIAFFKLDEIPPLFSKNLTTNGLKEEFPLLKELFNNSKKQQKSK